MNTRTSLLCSLLMCILLVASPVKADNQESVLKIVQKGGKITYVDLNENPEITFSSDYISISTKNLQFSYDDVEEFTFQMELPTAVSQMEAASSLVFSFTDANTIRIAGLASADGVFVSALDGKHFNVPMEQSGNEISLHLASLPHGAYIVVTPKQNYKFIKK
nr:hypothetical protein [uncultured Prevotella sp.]